MAYQWPEGTQFEELRLEVLERECSLCGAETHVKDYKRRRVFLLGGPCRIVSQMTQCSERDCPGAHCLHVAEEELSIAPPHWVLGWDVFALLGQLRFTQDRSVPEIRQELLDTYDFSLSEDAIEDYIARYQVILAARQDDPTRFREEYEDVDDVVLTIDGLQPEKGHETLYTVRELNKGRVWFAVPLVSASASEVQTRLIEKAKEWVDLLGKPVRAWMSDKEEAFVKGIRAVFPGVPHRYCQNHFLRDLAKPMLEEDSHAKVQMRKKVRGLRTIERGILEASPGVSKDETDNEKKVVLEYCSTVRGILNKNQGGPLDPPGLRMAARLKEVRTSIERSLELEPASETAQALHRLVGCINRGLEEVAEPLGRIPDYVDVIRKVRDTLEPGKTGGKRAPRTRTRQRQFNRICSRLAASEDEIEQAMAGVMERFEPGLFVGGEDVQTIQDNMDLERWFKRPKAHLRKIHGRQHAGVKIVVEGPSLALALDAHVSHRRPFREDELRPYFGARPSAEQLDAVERRKIMWRARSYKLLPGLLAELEEKMREAADQRRGDCSPSGSHERGGS